MHVPVDRHMLERAEEALRNTPDMADHGADALFGGFPRADADGLTRVRFYTGDKTLPPLVVRCRPHYMALMAGHTPMHALEVADDLPEGVAAAFGYYREGTWEASSYILDHGQPKPAKPSWWAALLARWRRSKPLDNPPRQA